MPVKKTITAAFSLLLLLAASAPAFACACCVNPGYYEISTGKPSSTELDMFRNFKFALPADLYMSEAGFDSIRGLELLRSDEEAGKSIKLSVENTFSGRNWRLSVKTGAGRKGTLVLPLPSSMVRYKVDLHDNPPERETSLYKELRLKGSVTGSTGFLRKGITKSTSYFLVFQGRGNGCDDISDFKRWRLEIDGPGARYAFFGKLD